MKDKLVKVKWLKEKSNHKVGDIINIKENLVELLIKKGDCKIIKEKGSSTGNESVKKEIKSPGNTTPLKHVTGNTDNTVVTDDTDDTEAPVSSVLCDNDIADKIFKDETFEKILRVFATSKDYLSFELIGKILDKDPANVRQSMNRKKEYFDQKKPDGKKSLSQLSQLAKNIINQRIDKFKKQLKEREDSLKEKEVALKGKDLVILEFKKFFNLYKKKIMDNSEKNEGIINIDFMDLVEFSIELAEELENNPRETINIMNLSLEDQGLISHPNIRIRNLPNSYNVPIEDFRTNHLEQFILVEGRIVSTSNVRPQCVNAKFECPSCGTVISVLQKEKKFSEPLRCSCGRRGGFKLISKQMINTAKIILEDLQEKTDNPHSSRLNCLLKDDLVNKAGMKILTPGNEIKSIGILKEIPVPLSRGGISVRSELAFDVNSIELCESEVEIEKFTKEEIKAIKNLSKKIDSDGLDEINTSFAPHIFGYEPVKNAIILQLCNKRNNGFNGIRNKPNILLIGDPGTSKSELGKFTVRITPGSRIATGGGSSAVGITASVVREEGEGYRVEPGAMVIAKEILFLDELNNLSDDDKPKLQEGMSEQKITINKANIHMSMPVTAGVLAAANPISGLFRIDEDMVKQFNLPAPIINRFDEIFVIKDNVNKDMDKSIARSMIKRERGMIKAKYSEDFLRKFFVYIRKLPEPTINEVMAKRLENLYTELRKHKSRSININPRIHEAMLRILKASAKIRFSKKIEEKDVERAINILSHSYYNIPDYSSFKIDKEQEVLG